MATKKFARQDKELIVKKSLQQWFSAPIWGSQVQHRQVQGYSSRPSLLHNASPPARTCRCRLFIGFCSILSHLSVFLFIMIYLSVCSDVLHDHAVSSLGSVEFNIRVDVCKKSRIRKILQKRQREYLRLFYVCKKKCSLYLYLRPWDTLWMIICPPARVQPTSATLSPNCLSEIVF